MSYEERAREWRLNEGMGYGCDACLDAQLKGGGPLCETCAKVTKSLAALLVEVAGECGCKRWQCRDCDYLGPALVVMAECPECESHHIRPEEPE